MRYDATPGNLPKPVGYGLVGAGAFGGFCVETYQALPELNVRAVADAHPETAARFAEAHGLEAMTLDAVLADPEIQIVHIATPPSTHREIAGRALETGKHVLVEKPLATTVLDGEALLTLAKEHGRVLAVNLVMRYDPLLLAAKRIADAKLLGEPLRATFENLAKDAALGPEHWFWNPALSGGIFVEHAVHFFDLFAWLFGPGEVRCADAVIRPGSDAVEAVRCTVRHGDVLADSYHGFTQAEAMDRQEMRLIFERGDIRLREWVPTEAEVVFVGTTEEADAVAALFPAVTSRRRVPLDGPVRHRWKESPADGVHTIVATTGLAKPELYRLVIGDLMRDAIARIEDPARVPRVTAEGALAALRTAVAASRAAGIGETAF